MKAPSKIAGKPRPETPPPGSPEPSISANLDASDNAQNPAAVPFNFRELAAFVMTLGDGPIECDWKAVAVRLGVDADDPGTLAAKLLTMPDDKAAKLPGENWQDFLRAVLGASMVAHELGFGPYVVPQSFFKKFPSFEAAIYAAANKHGLLAFRSLCQPPSRSLQ